MPVAKSAEAFRTISEASSELDVPQHVLRHWEEVFGQIRPMRRAGGRRYYRPVDLDLLRGVRVLLHEQGYTTKGVQKIFKENGVKYIAEIGRMSAAGETIEVRPVIDDDGGEPRTSADPGQNDGSPDRATQADAADDHASGSNETHDGRHNTQSASADVNAGEDLRGHPNPDTFAGAGAEEVRNRLTALLARLERVEAALDDATLALETFDDGDPQDTDDPDDADD